MTATAQWQRILVCLRYGIGDVVMEMPALRGLRSACPDAELWLLGARPAVQLFEGDPDFQALVCIQDFGFDHWGDKGSEEARTAFHQWFLAADFSCVLDPFHAVSGTQDTLTATGVPWRNASPAPRVPRRTSGGHGIAAIWYSAVDIWDLGNQHHRSPPAPRLHIPAQASRAANQRLAAWPGKHSETTHEHEGDDSREIVGIAPIASSELKRWPVERVLDVIHWLVREKQQRVLIFGVGSNQDLLRRRLRKAAPEPDLAIVAPTHLQETAALATRCRAFLSNDTGLMHLAAAVGTPTVGIFGPTAAHIYLPWNSLAVSSTRDCRYRLQEQFGPPQCVHAERCLIAPDSCINTISTEEITAAIAKLLDSGRAGPDETWTVSEPRSCSQQ